MKMLKSKQIEEAEKRLKILEDKYGMLNHIKEDFISDRTLYYSSQGFHPIVGSLFWISNRPELENIIKKFETEKNAVVYHCIYSKSDYGDMLNIFFVGENEEDWVMEEYLMQYRGESFAYIKNLEDDELSDFGNIRIRGINGGIIRDI